MRRPQVGEHCVNDTKEEEGRVLAKFYEARHGILQVVKKTLENIPHSQAALF